MYELKINTEKNAILCVLKGRFDADEAREYVQRFKEGVNRLEPGMVIITDLSEFVPSDDEARSILRDGSAYAVERGLGRGIRVVRDNVGSRVGNIQLNRSARELGYDVEVVTSREEAFRLLGW